MAELMGLGRLGSSVRRWNLNPRDPPLLQRPQSPRSHSLHAEATTGVPRSHTCSCGGGEAEMGPPARLPRHLRTEQRRKLLTPPSFYQGQLDLHCRISAGLALSCRQ